MNMFITNGNLRPSQKRPTISQENLASYSSAPRAISALNSSIIGRIHNAKSGCGSCGRH